MRKRLDHRTGKAISNATGKGKGSATVPASPIRWQEQVELKQTQVLESFLENRYANKDPMPASLRNPKSSPTYYDDLVKEMQEAPERTWVGGLMKRIKGSLRLT
jgi:cytochrome b pre-mRNA-processing protein 6